MTNLLSKMAEKAQEDRSPLFKKNSAQIFRNWHTAHFPPFLFPLDTAHILKLSMSEGTCASGAARMPKVNGGIRCQGGRWIPWGSCGPTPLSIMQCQLHWRPALTLAGWETLFQGSANSIYNQPHQLDFKIQYTSLLTGNSALMCGWRFQVWDFQVRWMKLSHGWQLSFVYTSGFRVGDGWLSELLSSHSRKSLRLSTLCCSRTNQL